MNETGPADTDLMRLFAEKEVPFIIAYILTTKKDDLTKNTKSMTI
jgi:hypothetical protein